MPDLGYEMLKSDLMKGILNTIFNAFRQNEMKTPFNSN